MARKVRNGQHPACLSRFKPYLGPGEIKVAESPGQNGILENANLAWRLCWNQIRGVLDSKIRIIHPNNDKLSQLEYQGIQISPNRCVWVVCSGATTTGPSGIFPFLADLKRKIPKGTLLFAIIFCPPAHRQKTEIHKFRGQAIFLSTMERLFELFNGQIFDQPYSIDGKYQIKLLEDPADLVFLCDSSIGGKNTLETDELSEIVAQFLFRFATGRVGETILKEIGNLTSGTRDIKRRIK